MKTDGIASAAAALRYWERRQEIAANNLANVNTTGFKAELGYARLTGDTPAMAASTDWREGPLTPTGNPLDLALRGHQFFVVTTPSGERFTRGGASTIDPQGYLADADGSRLAGEKGPIRVGGSDVSIDRTGRVAVDGVWIDRLRIETVAPNTTLQHEAGTRWIPDATRTAVALDARDVRQGHLEGSNVNSIDSMVDMITIQRNFAFAQKALSTLDDIRATISNQLGKPTG
ncbi:MAG: flagellar hook basal-body protein [Gemmatimonadaceae bacterium]|nr:flagellar hook basal-body protein [Gemmatimonadaceae bacterium]